MSADDGADSPVRQLFALERDVLVLSLAMFAFSLSFQMTTRFLGDYLLALGATSLVVGAFGSVGNLISAVYPYPGGALSDRIGSRSALTAFAVVSTGGFAIWALAPELEVAVAGYALPTWTWIFVGLFLAQAWKSFGLGATFAIVKQATRPDQLATGFASTETFRRLGFLVGPVLAAAVLATAGGFVTGFQRVLWVAVAFAALGTVAQHVLYEAEADSIGKRFEGLAAIRRDLRTLPAPLRPLLVADTLVRFANGMVYVFFVVVVTRFHEVSLAVPPVSAFGASLGGFTLPPAAFFGVLLGVEMAVALVSMLPVARLTRRVGLKPVVGLGFLVYATFPVLLITAPGTPTAMVALFAFSGLRFAGLPAHKALIVGPAEQDAGGRVTGSYYLLRNTVVIPSGAVGGLLYGISPALAFGAASAVGLVGVALFGLRGTEFEPAIATGA